MKKLLALLLACISLSCVSCGHDEETPADDVSEITTEITTEEETTEEEKNEDEEVSPFVGKWQGVKLIEDGEESDKLDDIPMWAAYQIELREDGSVAFGETTAELVNHKITWGWRKTSDTQGEFFNDDDDYDIYVLTLDEDYLIMTNEDSNDQLYLERVDEFTPYQLEEETTEKTTHEYIEDADPTAFIGKWECRKLTTNQKKQYLMNSPIEEICQLEIYDDHTAVISGVEVVGAEKFVVCDWGIVSENEIELTDNNGRIVFFTLDGDYLVDTEKDITVSLWRVDEFTPVKTDNNLFVGKWECEKIVIDGKETTEESGTPVRLCYHIELREDGSVDFDGTVAEPVASEIKWRRLTNSTEIEMFSNSDDDSFVAVLDGDYLIINDDEDSYTQLYFIKVDEFTQKETDTDPTVFYGKWQGEYMIDENGEKITDNAIPMLYQFEFNEDGTLSFGEVLTEFHEGDSGYTWEVADSRTITLYYSGSEEDINIAFNGEYLVYSEDTDVYLAKVDEFMPLDPNMYQ